MGKRRGLRKDRVARRSRTARATRTFATASTFAARSWAERCSAPVSCCGPTDRFGIATSDREKAVVVRSATDITVGSHFFGSIVARYEKPLGDDVIVGLHPHGQSVCGRCRGSLRASAARHTIRGRVHAALPDRPILRRRRPVSVPSRRTGFVHGDDHHHRERGAGDARCVDARMRGRSSPNIASDSAWCTRPWMRTRATSRGCPWRSRSSTRRSCRPRTTRPKDSNWTFSVRIFKRLWGAEFAPPARTNTAPKLEPEPTRPPSPPPAPTLP